MSFAPDLCAAQLDGATLCMERLRVPPWTLRRRSANAAGETIRFWGRGGMDILTTLGSVAPQTIALSVVALVLGGLLMGFMAGFFGIGGGAVIVPVLDALYKIGGVGDDVRLQMCVGTSLAIMIPTTWRSAMAHKAKGSLEEGVVKRLGPWIVLGVALGVLVAGSAPPLVFKIVWVLFGFGMGFKLLFGRDSWRLGDDLPTSKGLEAYATFVGLISTLLSIGGGAFIAGMLTLYNRPILKAIGTSAAFGPMIALPGALGFIWAGWHVAGVPPGSLGYVNLIVAALAVPASVFMAPYGAQAAHLVSRRTLEVLMAGFLMLVGARFLYALLAA
jgi:uncharacterized protein